MLRHITGIGIKMCSHIRQLLRVSYENQNQNKVFSQCFGCFNKKSTVKLKVIRDRLCVARLLKESIVLFHLHVYMCWYDVYRE